LGLKDTDNYRTLYDQKGEEVMWVVTACEPFRLEPKLWHFPIVGTVPYKGFFNKEDAIALARELEAQGYDVSVRNPGGWSTLGWFTDPILSGMLGRSEGDLASLIIHEMSHATIFVKDSVDFNENLASFIGDRGAEYFLISKYGRNSSQYLQYIQEDHDYVALVGHMLRGAKYLDSLYSVVTDKTPDEKRQVKEEAIRRIVVAADTLTLFSNTKPSARFRKSMPNNAYFMMYIHYQSGQEELRREWQQSFAGDLRAYIRHLSGRYPYL
jgi:predicted aminopeptidase